jgi:protein lifeguard
MIQDLEGGRADNLLGDNLSVQVRHGFIRKVYGILVFMLLITVAIGGATEYLFKSIGNSSSARSTFGIILVLTVVAHFALIMVVSCFPAYLRKSPLNLCLLGGIAVTLGILLGVVTSGYSAKVVIGAAGMTCAITAGLSAFAFQTKYDFTSKASYIWGISLALMCILIMSIFFPGNSTWQLAVACITLLAFSVFMVYDTQLIVGGKHRQHELSIDDYAAGALLIYLDIINIFQALLAILGRDER